MHGFCVALGAAVLPCCTVWGQMPQVLYHRAVHLWRIQPQLPAGAVGERREVMGERVVPSMEKADLGDSICTKNSQKKLC